MAERRGRRKGDAERGRGREAPRAKDGSRTTGATRGRDGYRIRDAGETPAPGRSDDAASEGGDPAAREVPPEVLARARRLRIAFDGPAGSGKSSIAAAVAQEIEAFHLDTGAIYRAITLACLEAGVDLTDAEACSGRAKEVVVEQRGGRTYLDGRDVEDAIRGDEVSGHVSTVSAHATVREVLLDRQRTLAADGGIVEGRDIGTVVLPDADVKLFLTASAEERARRRASQLGREDLAELQAAIEARDALDSEREVAPLRAADDAWLLDTTGLEFEDVVEIVAGRVIDTARQRLEEERAQPRRLPRVAIVGRPNVGKSTLVNRFLRERITIVESEPGVTRDRTEHVATWGGREFVVVDTGGWEHDAQGIVGTEVVAQTERAIADADVVVQVVDGSVQALEDDLTIAKVLRRSGTPTLLAVNKMDAAVDAAGAGEHVRLGLGEPRAISARNGRGVEDLLDAVVAAVPDEVEDRGALIAAPGTPHICIVGRPNVGKSSLFNRLVGDDRAIVHDAPHTTRDAIDSLVQLDGRDLVVVDTAGMRRRYRAGEDLEQYAVDRTRAAIDRSDVALFIIDAGEPIGAQEQRLAAMLRESGCGLIIVCNKWDMVDEDRREELERELDRLLGFAKWAPRVNISALTGRGVTRIAPMIATVLENHRRRIPTSVLNQVITRAVEEHAPARSGTRPVRIRYSVQVDVAPPRVLIFATGPLEDSYRRYLERTLRERYDLTGVPLVIEDRGRGGGDRRGKRGGAAGEGRGGSRVTRRR
jgi:GTP-binding protein